MRRLTSRHLAGRVSRTANEHHPTSTTSQHEQQPDSYGVETMSTTQPLGRTAAAPPLRVRDQAREAVTLIAFSAATASALALGLLLLTHLGPQG